MGNYEQLKQAVSNVIKTNGTQAITGQVLQNTLLNMISTLGRGANFAGLATTNTNPGVPDGPVFYFATSPGTYVNFNGITIDKTDGIYILCYDNGGWKKEIIAYNSVGIEFNALDSLTNQFEDGGVYVVKAGGNIVCAIALQTTEWHPYRLRQLIITSAELEGLSETPQYPTMSGGDKEVYKIYYRNYDLSTNKWSAWTQFYKEYKTVYLHDAQKLTASSTEDEVKTALGGRTPSSVINSMDSAIFYNQNSSTGVNSPVFVTYDENNNLCHITIFDEVTTYKVVLDLLSGLVSSADSFTMVKKGTGLQSEVFNDYNNIASGGYSHSEGRETTASGTRSHAEGTNTIASGYGSHAEGGSTKATGQYSHAEGLTSIATGLYSHAEGFSTAASGKYSHAEGQNTTAEMECSHAEGYVTKATGNYSHAEGYKTNASGLYSHVEGRETTASGGYSHAEGYKTNASGLYSHAEGDSTNASEHSHAEGYKTQANGKYSHAEGYITTANGSHSHAEGCRTQTAVNGTYSHAEGFETTANGGCSHAEGAYTQSIGDYSHAGGYNTVTNNEAECAFGKYNSSTASTDPAMKTIFSIGNGNSTTRHNALELKEDGTLIIQGGIESGHYLETDPELYGGLEEIPVDGSVSSEDFLRWLGLSPNTTWNDFVKICKASRAVFSHGTDMSYFANIQFWNTSAIPYEIHFTSTVHDYGLENVVFLSLTIVNRNDKPFIAGRYNKALTVLEEI